MNFHPSELVRLNPLTRTVLADTPNHRNTYLTQRNEEVRIEYAGRDKEGA
jgi:hypothetical protein